MKTKCWNIHQQIISWLSQSLGAVSSQLVEGLYSLQSVLHSPLLLWVVDSNPVASPQYPHPLHWWDSTFHLVLFCPFCASPARDCLPIENDGTNLQTRVLIDSGYTVSASRSCNSPAVEQKITSQVTTNTKWKAKQSISLANLMELTRHKTNQLPR